jgi:hypothetical protein
MNQQTCPPKALSARRSTTRADAAARAERNIEKLISRLPGWAARAVRRILKPGAVWVRVPVAICLIPGGMLGFLPVLGLWMLPLGLLMLSVDVPILRRGLYRFINWLADRRPHWFA